MVRELHHVFQVQLAWTASGNIVVTDSVNHRVLVVDARDGALRTWGSAGSEAGQFLYPHGVVCSPNGLVYIVDQGNYRVQLFREDGTLIGQWGRRGSLPGAFMCPTGIALSPVDGEVYVCDSGRVQVGSSGPLAAGAAEVARAAAIARNSNACCVCA